ncbi:MAG: heparinase II/III family protein [Pseudomonadota bacterium]
MKRLLLLLHTLRFLKVKQLFYRVYYRLRKPRVRNLSEPVLRKALSPWSGAAFHSPATDDGEVFTFLNKTGDLSRGWNNPDFSKLWLYNLHYQDDLNAVRATERTAFSQQLVENWIAANPPLKGNGWEPYCISLRIVNWVKWLSRLQPDEIDPLWLRSLACQADALEQQLEFHILGNHLFANAKALVFVGSFLGGQQGDAWLKKGLKLLDQEVPEQFLDDGGHYELSPMYHAILLWDMCDLLQLKQQNQLYALDERENVWRRVIELGINWLRKMVHPDGDIAFFNDATLGIAPTLNQLEAYTEQLNCLPESSAESVGSSLQLHHLKSTGYLVIDWSGQHRALLDTAQLGPDYQPGHAHADTFSFELSLFDQRLFVNSGTSQYSLGAEREYQRGTRAHNTVEVEDENSSEVWAGFRVARRAEPVNVSVSYDARVVRVSASHDGYRRLPGKVLTKRKWLFEEGVIQVIDQLNGSWSKAISRFYCHPSIIVEQLNEREILLILQQGQKVRLSVEGASELRLVDSAWHPGFGLSTPNRCIEAVLSGPQLVSRIDYQNV